MFCGMVFFCFKLLFLSVCFIVNFVPGLNLANPWPFLRKTLLGLIPDSFSSGLDVSSLSLSKSLKFFFTPQTGNSSSDTAELETLIKKKKKNYSKNQIILT